MHLARGLREIGPHAWLRLELSPGHLSPRPPSPAKGKKQSHFWSPADGGRDAMVLLNNMSEVCREHNSALLCSAPPESGFQAPRLTLSQGEILSLITTSLGSETPYLVPGSIRTRMKVNSKISARFYGDFRRRHRSFFLARKLSRESGE